MSRILFVLLLPLAFSNGANASDGAIEINQLCVANGCFAGDDPGFPVELTQDGMTYRFTSDLAHIGTTDMIFVKASNVTIDMNGFALIGPVDCTGLPVTSCDNSSVNGSGIVNEASRGNIHIKNGSIDGMNNHCIFLFGSGHIVENLRVQHCAGSGVSVFTGGSALVRNVSVFQVRGSGILFAGDGVVLDSVVRGAEFANVAGGSCGDNVLSIDGGFADTCSQL